MSDEGALDELRRNAGSQFDPDVVSAFCVELRAQRAAESARASRGAAARDATQIPAGSRGG